MTFCAIVRRSFWFSMHEGTYTEKRRSKSAHNLDNNNTYLKLHNNTFSAVYALSYTENWQINQNECPTPKIVRCGQISGRLRKKAINVATITFGDIFILGRTRVSTIVHWALPIVVTSFQPPWKWRTHQYDLRLPNAWGWSFFFITLQSLNAK